VISGGLTRSYKTVNGGCIDNCSSAEAPHDRDAMLHAQSGCLEVMVENAMPFFFAGLFESEPAVDARVC
jgi:hypothetical protein